MSTLRPRYVYQNLANYTEYEDFEYKFDFATVITSISFCLFIPSFYCYSKMLIIYWRNPKVTVASNGIHPFVLKSFLLMQFWNTCNTVFDFITTRIPNTTIFTSTCIALGPNSFLRFMVAGVFFTFQNAQFCTVLFCLMRVLILYTLMDHDKLCRRLFITWCLVTYSINFAMAFNNIFATVLCLQLDAPYQDGAIYVTTSFVFRNNFMNTLYFIFSTGQLIVIVVTTGLVIRKLRSKEMKKAARRSLNRFRAETTVTVATFLIIIPLLMAQGLTIASLTKSPYYSNILSVRPLMLDLRVNIVSMYFYMTHPVFRKKSGPVVALVKSVASSTL